MTFHFAMDHLHDELIYARCGCGYWCVYTPEGWQHDSAAWFWGGDHDPDLDAAAEKLARQYEVTHCEHRPDDLPEPGDRCKYCGIKLTWVGPSPITDWEPVWPAD